MNFFVLFNLIAKTAARISDTTKAMSSAMVGARIETARQTSKIAALATPAINDGLL